MTWNEALEILKAARRKSVAARAVLETMGASPSEAIAPLAAAWKLVAEVAAALPPPVQDIPRAVAILPWIRGAATVDLAGLSASREAALAGPAAVSPAHARRELTTETARVARAISSARIQCLFRIGPGWRRAAWSAGQVSRALGGLAVILLLVWGVRAVIVQPGLSQGLTAYYWRYPTEKGQSMERIDHAIDFDWGLKAPLKGFPVDKFSIRWEGCVLVEKGDRAVLEAGADDAIRVVVDGRTVIDDWGAHGFRLRQAKQALAPGKHPIRVTYQDRKGAARVYLGWSLDGSAGVAIPPKNLLPRTVVAQSYASDTGCPTMPAAKK